MLGLVIVAPPSPAGRDHHKGRWTPKVLSLWSHAKACDLCCFSSESVGEGFFAGNEGCCRRSSLRCAAVGNRSSLRWLSYRIITKVLAATRPSSYCPALGMLLSRRSEDEHSVGRGRHRSPCWAQGPAAPEMNEINRDADAFDQLSQHDRCRWPRRVLGPPWDHTLCVMVNDLRVCARHARSQIGYALAMTCGNALPLFTGGQVVARSNPVSPTTQKHRFTCTGVVSGKPRLGLA